MTKKELEHFQAKLIKEKKLLEDELESVGRKDLGEQTNWDATPGKIEIDAADENEIADKFEELEENESILHHLEPQLKDVNDALDKIKNNTYGICEISGEPIEIERLEANPSARTCMKHMNQR